MKPERGERAGAESGPGSAGLLAALLVRFPELAKVDLDPGEGRLRLAFALRQPLEEGTAAAFRSGLADALGAFARVTGRRQAEPAGCWQEVEQGLSFLRVELRLEDLSFPEVSLCVELAREATGPDLVVDEPPSWEEGEDLALAHDQLLEEMFDELRESGGGPLVALREDGRVLVFNR